MRWFGDPAMDGRQVREIWVRRLEVGWPGSAVCRQQTRLLGGQVTTDAANWKKKKANCESACPGGGREEDACGQRGHGHEEEGDRRKKKKRRAWKGRRTGGRETARERGAK